MNTFLIKIKNLPRVVHNFFKINPHRHWMVLLYIFFGLVLFLILFSFYLLYEIKTEQIFQVSVIQEKISLLKEDLLEKTIESFDNKAKREVDIKNNPPVYSDPSL